jgi:aldehyde:ferredoxin oxidoreductase
MQLMVAATRKGESRVMSEAQIRGGYMGKLLRVNLSTGEAVDEPLDMEKAKLYLGGSAMGGRILLEEVPAEVGAYDEGNRLMFLAGPFSGTAVPGSGTYTVVTKGPLTNQAATAQANGWFGARIKAAGYDGIIVQGISPKWVYLVITEGVVEIRDAGDVMGMDTQETQAHLTEALGLPKASVACIGPAGEKMVRFANISSDYAHFASTNGIGAVMGSKRLKAIVAHGTAKVPVYDEVRFKEAAKAWQKGCQETIMGSTVSAVGTGGFLSPAAVTGWLPVKNYTTTVFDEHPQYNGDALRASTGSTRTPCHACPLHHSTRLEVLTEPYKGLVTDEPEYEGLAGFGANIGVTNVNETLKLCDVNDRMGMDLKECTFVISLVMELYEAGVLTKDDTDGLELTWGNTEAVLALLPKIAHREGFGDLLAEGVYRTAQKIGPEALKRAIYIREGIAPHVHDVRGMWGYLMGQVVSNFGSIEGFSPADMLPEADIGLETPPERFTDPLGLADAQAKWARKYAFVDAAGTCFFTTVALPGMVEALNALTGLDLTDADILEGGWRHITTLKLFNIRHGFKREQDTASPRILEANPDGPNVGISVAKDLASMVERYYMNMGWDAEGRPTQGTIDSLGIAV